MVSPKAREIAELLTLNTPPSPGQERIVDPRYCAIIGRDAHPAHNVVQRVRVAVDEIEATVAEVHARFRARGRTRITWEIGPSSTPVDLAYRLLAMGMVPDVEGVPLMTGMVLSRPLPAIKTAATVRRVRTPLDFHTSASIYHACFGRGEPPPTFAETEATFNNRRDQEVYARYLALLDGEPVATASACFVDQAVVLGGGATLPEARGKGAYVALVAARWEEAAARGTPVLVTQAGAMSRPILERLGFEAVVEVRVLLDTFT